LLANPPFSVLYPVSPYQAKEYSDEMVEHPDPAKTPYGSPQGKRSLDRSFLVGWI
jgi:hypothetical protein